MIEHENWAVAGDLEDLAALIALAEDVARELGTLEAKRRGLQDELQRTGAKFTSQLNAGHLPVMELAELARVGGALADIEGAIAELLTRLQATLAPQQD